VGRHDLLPSDVATHICLAVCLVLDIVLVLNARCISICWDTPVL